MILLNNFEYPNNLDNLCEESMSQMRTDSARSNSKRVRKFSRPKESVLKN